jgi:crossover junction endodeoxyribonuclease RusA
MSRYDRNYLAGRYVAQEARKEARAGDHAYASDGATRFQSGAHVDTSTSGGVESRHATAQEDRPRVGKALPVIADARSTTGQPCAHRAGVATGPLTLPWPPSGNSAVRHAQGAHYLRPEVIAYRDSVAALCARFAPTPGRYHLHVHLSPPDARKRDADNALKSILDALVKGGYLIDDSLTYMRELHVTTDDDRLGHVRAEARPAT